MLKRQMFVEQNTYDRNGGWFEPATLWPVCTRKMTELSRARQRHEVGKAFGCSADVGELSFALRSVRSREAVPALKMLGIICAMVGV